MDEKRKPEVVLIGLDGATFDLILPMVEGGKLPAIGKFLKEGVWGKLESTIPPTTPPAWSTMLTGTNPGRHGIFDFRLTAHEDPQRPLIHLGKMRGMKIWEALNRMEKTCGFLNVPVMYPPSPLNGWVISGMMAPSKESLFVYPESLQKELLEKIPDYVIDVDIPKYDNTFWEDIEVFLNDLDFCTKKRAEALFYLWDTKPANFLMAVFIATDRIGHLLWKFCDTRSPLWKTKVGQKVRDRVEKIYAIIDEMLGEVAKRVSKNGSTLIIMSDHGFGETEAFFNANYLLEEMGLLRVKKESAFRKRMFYRAWKVGDSEFVKKILPKSFQRKLRDKIRKGRSSFINDVEPFLDFEKTKVFYASIPCHGYFIRRKGNGAIVRSDSEYEEIRKKIKRSLEEIRQPSGESLVTGIWDREEIYQGPMVGFAPDVVFSVKNYAIVPRPLLGATELLRGAENTPNGFHRMDGIVIIWGEGVKSSKIEGAKMVDIAPTIMQLMNLPVPPSMEGKSLIGNSE